MNPFGNPSSDNPFSAEDGWIALAPVHGFLGILLLSALLQDLVWMLLPVQWPGWRYASWAFTLLHWGLGGVALSVAYQALGQSAQGSPRRVGFVLASVLMAAKVVQHLAWKAAPGALLEWQAVWMISEGVLLAFGLATLIWVLSHRGDDPGGRFDAAIAIVALVGGFEWIGLLVLVLAAMRKHPLLAAQWQVLRSPRMAMESRWFDGRDEDLRLRHLGACALFLALAVLVLHGRLIYLVVSGMASLRGTALVWAITDLAAAYLGSLLLAFHVNRHARGRKGRGPAIAALLINSLPLLVLLAAATFLALILTDVIHFRVF